jgi:hypothetical protein
VRGAGRSVATHLLGRQQGLGERRLCSGDWLTLSGSSGAGLPIRDGVRLAPKRRSVASLAAHRDARMMSRYA